MSNKYIDNYEQMSAEEIAIISKHCEHKHDSHYSYRKRYFKNHPDHTLEDFHEWEFHYMSANWQEEIWIQSAEEFEYHWPYHAAFITDMAEIQ